MPWIVAHVERRQRCRAAGGAHGVVELFQAADGARHRDHMRARARERERRRVADAARGAGDERDPISKRLRHSSARLGEQRELARRRVLRRAVGERGRIFAGEAMVGELRADRIAAFLAHGAIDAFDRKEGQRIGADEFRACLRGRGWRRAACPAPACRCRNNRDG